jgi:hypothetical protein
MVTRSPEPRVRVSRRPRGPVPAFGEGLSVLDRSGWSAGPWDAEPEDRVAWTDEATGYPCIVRRSSNFGFWCAYVGVSPGHPAHGVNYHDLDAIEVHGGLTYSQECDGDLEEGVCHVPSPGEPDDVWWFGLDFGHAFDLGPKLYWPEEADDEGVRESLARLRAMQTYHPLSEARAECAKLARQLKEMERSA